MKYRNVVVVICLLSILNLGCQNNNENQATRNEAKVLSSLASFNANYMKAKDEKKQLKGFWDKMGKVCAISGADFLGATGGFFAAKELAVMAGVATGGTGAAVVLCGAATICGVGASYSAFKALESVKNVDGLFPDEHVLSELTCEQAIIVMDSVVTTEDILSQLKSSPFEGDDEIAGEMIDLPEEYQDLNQIGYYHNVVLEEIYKRRSISEQGVELNNSALEHLSNNSQFVSTYDQLYEFVDKSIVDDVFNTDLYLQELEKNGQITALVKQIFELYIEVYNYKPETIEDIKDITNRYIQLIETSNVLTNEEKQLVYSAFSVAYASPQFWLEKI